MITENYAAMLPGLDWLFGTIHLPKGQHSQTFGIDGDIPNGFVAQMSQPFRNGKEGTQA